MDFNSYWYLGLALLSLLLLIYVYIKTKNNRIFLLLLAMIGLGYMIESFIYIFFNSYHYYPHLLKHDQYYDSNMGAIASNFFALPVAATFIAALRKSYWWIILITCLFVGVEWLFLKLHLYKHNWWRLEFTAIGLLVYFPIAKGLYKKIMQPIKGSMHFILLFLIIGPILGTLHVLPIMLFNNRSYHLGLFENLSHDTTAYGVIYYLCITLFLVFLARINWKHTWIKYLLIAIIACSITIVFSVSGILVSYLWWDKYYYILLPLFTLMITTIINKRLLMGPPQ